MNLARDVSNRHCTHLVQNVLSVLSKCYYPGYRLLVFLNSLLDVGYMQMISRNSFLFD